MESLVRRCIRHLRFALVLVGIVLLSGCFSTKAPAPKFYRSAEFDGVAGPDAKAAYDLHITPTPGSAPFSLVKLPERALAALIEAYAADPAMRAKIPALLTAPVRSATPEATLDNSHVRFKKRFTFTIVTSNMHPANRVYEAALTATAPNNWRFVEWSGFEVKERSIKLATVEAALSRKHSASVTLVPPQIAELTGASIGAEQTRTDGFKRELDFEVVEFLPRFEDEVVELNLSAPFPQLNLAGSYGVDLTLEYVDPGIQQFVDFTFENGKYSKHLIRGLQYVPDLVDKSPDPKSEPLIPDTAIKQLDFSYNERVVFNGRESNGEATLDEGDDTALYRRVQATPKAAPLPRLLEGDELQAVVVVAMHNGAPVYFYDPSRHERPEDAVCLSFTSGREAQKFKDWVRSQKVDEKTIVLDGSRVVWELLIEDKSGTRKRLDGSGLDQVRPFVFERFTLNAPHRVAELERLKCRNPK